VKKEMPEDTNEENQEPEANSATFSKVMLLFMAGFVLVFIGVLILIVASTFSGNGSASVGIVIFIGPFPIVLGAGPNAEWLILIGAIVAALSVAIFALMRRKMVEEVS
jgi:uncharacterized membrane protein